MQQCLHNVVCKAYNSFLRNQVLARYDATDVKHYLEGTGTLLRS